MASITCPSCFASASYQYEKPSFCLKCGKKYTAAFQTPSKVSRANKLKEIPYLDEDNDEEARYENTKESWKSRFSNGVARVEQSGPKGLTFSQVVMTEHSDGPLEKRTAAQVLAELAKENGSMKTVPFSEA